MDRDAAARAIDAFLRALGRDPEREPELVGTAARVAAAYADELIAGYAVDVDALLAPAVFAGRSDLVILDAEHLDQGPVATVKLPTRVVGQIHGLWVPQHQLASVKA